MLDADELHRMFAQDAIQARHWRAQDEGYAAQGLDCFGFWRASHSSKSEAVYAGEVDDNGVTKEPIRDPEVELFRPLLGMNVG